MATRTPARTVSKGSGLKSFKNILDLPFKLKWPTVSQETASEILAQLVKSLDGVKVATTNPQRRRRRSKNTTEENDSAEDVVPVAKRQCLDTGEGTGLPTSAEQESSPPAVEKAETSTIAEKRSQFVVGLKEVTKALEKGALRAVVVCLSAKPPLLHHHIQILTATRGVPCIALHGVSDAIAPLLGLRSALTIGLKNIYSAATVDHFSTLYTLIATRATKIDIPWLNALPLPGTPFTKLAEMVPVKADMKNKNSKSKITQQADRELSKMKAGLPIIDAITITPSSSRKRYAPATIKKTIITPKNRKWIKKAPKKRKR